MHRLSLAGLMLGCLHKGKNSDLTFRISLRKRETFKTHIKEASQLGSSFCSMLVSLLLFLQPVVGSCRLVTSIWVSACGPRHLKRKKKKFLMVSYFFGILAAKLDEAGELSKSAAVKEIFRKTSSHSTVSLGRARRLLAGGKRVFRFLIGRVATVSHRSMGKRERLFFWAFDKEIKVFLNSFFSDNVSAHTRLHYLWIDY